MITAAGRVADRTRVLKHGDTFAVFDHCGDITRGGLGEQGLYHHGTRHLSRFDLELDGRPPFFLGSTVRDENDQLAVALTNFDVADDDEVRVPLGTLHLALKTFLWDGTCYQQLRIKNHGLASVAASVDLHFAADYADIFELSGKKRKARGEDLSAEVTADCVILGYRGLDHVVRRTVLAFSPTPTVLTASTASYRFSLPPQAELGLQAAIACERGSSAARRLRFEDARRESEREVGRYRAWSCHLRTSNGQINAWVDRAVSDLHMMTTALPTGPYPYAGVPWLNTPFGRDGIITALECLWLRPALARGVLGFLASTQATRLIPEEDAEPGKILHESRGGEMATLREVPFGRYYGSVDATPLFVLLAGDYYERTGDRDFIKTLWPNIEAALGWIDHHGIATASSSISGSPPTACSIRDGRTATMPCSTPTARRPRVRSPCARSRGMSTRPGEPPRPSRSCWAGPSEPRSSPARPGRCATGSRRRSGARTCPPTRWPSTVRSGHAGCARRTRASASSRASSTRSAPPVWPARSWAPTRSPDGGSGPSPPVRCATIR
ncbi:MAG TPA: glycogen debranching N-terminal domain-containing protein [Methylomirabilota bacterium]|nr:glycogen debranching N-terminal domain-containing protein [Methylomirabilota bacterium]